VIQKLEEINFCQLKLPEDTDADFSRNALFLTAQLGRFLKQASKLRFAAVF